MKILATIYTQTNIVFSYKKRVCNFCISTNFSLKLNE